MDILAISIVLLLWITQLKPWTLTKIKFPQILEHTTTAFKVPRPKITTRWHVPVWRKACLWLSTVSFSSVQEMFIEHALYGKPWTFKIHWFQYNKEVHLFKNTSGVRIMCQALCRSEVPRKVNKTLLLNSSNSQNKIWVITSWYPFISKPQIILRPLDQ